MENSEQTSTPMLERDGYPDGVPCWVDTEQPDPPAAAEFYGGLFGWELEDRMPAEAPGHYFVATIRGKDVAAIGSQMEGAPQQPAWNTYVWADSADDAAARAKEAGGSVLAEPFDVMQAGRMAVIADPQGAVIRGLGAGEPSRRPARQRAGHLEFQRAEHNRHRRRATLLQRRLRLGGAGARAGRDAVLDVAAARLRRPPRAGRSRPAPPDGRPGRARGLRGLRRLADAAGRRPSPTPRRTGASPSRSTTRTRPPRRPASWAAPC